MTKKSILLIIAIVILDIIAIGIIPLNLFCLNMPEYITIILAIGVVLLNFVFWFRRGSKMAAKVILSLVSIVTVLLSLFGAYCNPYWNSLNFRSNYTTSVNDDNMILTRAEALEDLDYAMKYLQKLHPACYHGIPADVAAQYVLSRQRLENCDSIDICMLSQEIESVFSVLGDGHTLANAGYNEPHYLKYIYEHNQAGDALVRINGMTLDELFDQNSHLISYDAKSWGMTWIYNFVSSVEGLRYLGLSVEDGVEFTFRSESGQETSFTFVEDDFVTYEEYVEFNQITSGTQEQTPFVYYEIDDENDIAILTLDSCNYNEEYRKCLRNMFQEIKESGIQNVAVDLRNNGGGNSLVANEFFRYLDIDSYEEWGSLWRLGIFQIRNNRHIIQNDRYEEFVFKGNLYLLTSVNSFSSAMEFAEFVKDNHMGTIIGEAPGNDPSGYGEISMFRLPHSGIFIQISTKQWFRLDESLEHQLVEPDVPCDAEEAVEYLYRELAVSSE